MKIYREKAGVLSEKPVWVAQDPPYVYIATTREELVFFLITEWKHKKHLIG